MSYNSDLQANNEELQAILNTVNALPNANSSGAPDCVLTSDVSVPFTGKEVTLSVVSGSFDAVVEKANRGEKPNVLYCKIGDFFGSPTYSFVEATYVSVIPADDTYLGSLLFYYNDEQWAVTFGKNGNEEYINCEVTTGAGQSGGNADFVVQDTAPEDTSVLWVDPTDDSDDELPDSGGNVDFVVQDTPPEDTSVLWVDPTDSSDDVFQKAVNAALAQAKESGEFDGKDYVLTPADKTEIAEMAAELVDVPEGSGGGISVTGAEVGQTVKIASVDENGVPTAWEPTDFPSGGGGEAWELIYYGEITEDVNGIIVDKDNDGNVFSLKEFRLVFDMKAPAEKETSGFSWYRTYKEDGSYYQPFYTILDAHGTRVLTFYGLIREKCAYASYFSNTNNGGHSTREGINSTTTTPVTKFHLFANADNMCGAGTKVALFGVRA